MAESPVEVRRRMVLNTCPACGTAVTADLVVKVETEESGTVENDVDLCHVGLLGTITGATVTHSCGGNHA